MKQKPWSSGVAVVRREMLAKLSEVEETINIAKQVILRDNIVEIKRVKQLVLRFVVAAHHRTSLRQSTHTHYLIDVLSEGVFQQNRPILSVSNTC